MQGIWCQMDRVQTSSVIIQLYNFEQKADSLDLNFLSLQNEVRQYALSLKYITVITFYGISYL